MPKILMLSSNFSGIDDYIAERLKKKHWRVSVVPIPIPNQCAHLATLDDFKFKITHPASRRKIHLHKHNSTFIARSQYCEKIIDKFKNGVDMILQLQGLFMPAMDLRKIHIPYVVFTDYTMKLSEAYPPWLCSDPQEWYKFEKQLYQMAALNIVNNENAKKSLCEHYAVKNNKVIQLNIGSRFSGHAEGNKHYDGRTILFVGDDFQRKGGEVLLGAFKKVKTVIPKARLIIVGVNKKDVGHTGAGVIFTGYVGKKEELQSLYQRACVFVLPSSVEPMAFAFLEAMDYKLPCIGTNVDGTPEIIEDGKTGFLVPVGNAASLAERIVTLLENTDLAKMMGESGYLRLKEKYNWDTFAQKLDANLRSIIGYPLVL